MADKLKACGKNGYGETFWKLCVPDEHCSPGLEVGISAGERGVTIGGRLIKWADLDAARAKASQGCEAVDVVAITNRGVCYWQAPHLLDLLPNGTQLMTVAQHQRIMAALSADNQRIVPVEPLLAAPHPFSQVVGRVHHNSEHAEPVRAVLNSIGRQLPDNAPLYTHPADPGAVAVQEMEWLEQWLLLAAEPVGQECCRRAYPECCGNSEPVYRNAVEIADAMEARRDELRALLAKGVV